MPKKPTGRRPTQQPSPAATDEGVGWTPEALEERARYARRKLREEAAYKACRGDRGPLCNLLRADGWDIVADMIERTTKLPKRVVPHKPGSVAAAKQRLIDDLRLRGDPKRGKRNKFDRREILLHNLTYMVSIGELDETDPELERLFPVDKNTPGEVIAALDRGPDKRKRPRKTTTPTK